MRISSLYIHIPFCRRKCYYCDFASQPLAGREAELAAYPALLRQELALYSQLDLSRLQTVYFGGGTPSLLAPEAVAEILAWLPPAAETREITLEANPEGLDLAQLRGYAAAGVNRLSLGAQSFQDQALAQMGRQHSASQVRQGVDLARQAGLDNISLDLIYGLPEQTMDSWRYDLEQAIALDTPHLSLYGLNLHPGTPWGQAAQRGEIKPPDQDLSADLLELAIDTLTGNGYQHYEISNFARPGAESRHNLAYWQRENYLGLGVAAASCLNQRRFANLTSLPAYRQALAAGQRPLAEEECLEMEQVLGEAVFLALRLARGVDFAAFYAQYGVEPQLRYRRQIRRLQKLGLLTVDAAGMRLTRRGLLLGNEVFAEFV